MADFNENGVFGGVQFEGGNNELNNGVVEEQNNNNVFANMPNENANNFGENNAANFKPVEKDKAVTERGLWSRIKAFLFQEIDLYAPIKVELTPYQQKVENEINEFLHQEITFKGIANFFKGKK